MKLVVWCAKESIAYINNKLKDDEIVTVWKIGEENILTDEIVNNPYICILLLDGNYNKMAKWCIANKISLLRILDWTRYKEYCFLEKRYMFLEKQNVLSFFELHAILKQVAKSFENNNDVLMLCKKDFIKRINMISCNNLWNY